MPKRKALIPNELKLVLIVLAFFLALTFVRGFEVNAPSTVVFTGNEPFPYPIAVTNTGTESIQPSFIADGPFSLAFAGDPTSIHVAPRELKVIQFSLFPNEGLREGDTYFGRIRVIAGDDSREIIIQASKEDTPISPFAGLAALSLGDGAQIVDALLILIVIVLGISLIFRLRNRM